MGLFRLLQPGGAEAVAGGGSHAAAPQVRRPLPAPGQAAQDGGGGPGPDQCQGQSVPGCRGQGDDHQGQLCESGAGYRDLEVVFTGVSSQEGFCGDYPQFSEPASPSPFPPPWARTVSLLHVSGCLVYFKNLLICSFMLVDHC